MLLRSMGFMTMRCWLQAKAKRRIVVGMREVTKLVERKKLKAVLIAPDIEKIQADGGTASPFPSPDGGTASPRPPAGGTASKPSRQYRSLPAPTTSHRLVRDSGCITVSG